MPAVSRRAIPADQPDCLDEPSEVRPRREIHAELRAICREHCTPEMNAWLDERFPLAGDQLELFR